MKFNHLNIKNTTLGMVLSLVILATSCEITPIANPNGPTIEELTDGASLVDLQLLATGLESSMRTDMEFYFWTTSIVGREYWDLRQTDPRYTGELLGAQGAPLDNNGFLTTRSFSARYKAIRNAYILEEAVANSSAGLTDAERNGFTGVSKTLRALSLLMILNRQYENGCRLDTQDPDNLGPFVSYTEGLAGVKSLLDEAAAELANASFAYTSSFAEDPTMFLRQNRAIAARVALYQGDNAAVLALLDESFFDQNGPLERGMYYRFSAAGNDQFNPLYNVPEQTFYIVHPTVISDAAADDDRVEDKTLQLPSPVTADGLTGDYQVVMFESNTSPAPIIRNEELILIYAEANVGTNNTAAVDAINIIRNEAEIGDYTGGTTDAELMNEILNQRRYSLFGEGHRWIDMRRMGRLNEIPTDRPGDVVHVQFPRPVLEE